MQQSGDRIRRTPVGGKRPPLSFFGRDAVPSVQDAVFLVLLRNGSPPEQSSEATLQLHVALALRAGVASCSGLIGRCQPNF